MSPTPAKSLARAIAIPTVNPPGDEAKLAEYYVAALRAMGIEAALIPTPETQTSADEPPPAPASSRRAAAWGRLRGTGAKPPLVLLSHLDVVPAEATEWKIPPFEGRIVDGYVHGRGSLDAKGVGIVQLFALAALARREQPLARDIIFLATPDEEAGGRAGAGWLAEHRPDLLDGAEYLLTEGGGIRPAADGHPAIWGVTVTEKSPCWLELTARGTPGHSSAPRSDAAVPHLIAALDRVRRMETAIRVLPEVAAMFRAMASFANEDDRDGYADLTRALATDSIFRRRFLREPGKNALVRNTISITELEGAPRTNVAPAAARAHLDVRLLPGEDCASFRDLVREVIGNPEIEIATLLAFPSRSSSTNTTLYRAIEAVAEREDPEARVVPRMIGGFTDAHWFRELGIVAYGFVPRRLDPTEAGGVHGHDERVRIEALEEAVELLREIVEELDRR